MGKHRRKTLVVVFYRNLRHGIAPTVNELLHALEILAGLTIRLTGFANNHALYGLTRHILLKEIKQFRSSDSRQPAGYQLKRVGDCQTCTFLSVIYRNDTCHGLLRIKQPSTGILVLKRVTAVGSIQLRIEGRCHNTIHGRRNSLVQNNLTTKDVIAKADELTFPQSVIDFMKGMVGQPYQGFPKDVQKAILKGEEPIDCRPGELLEPIDLDATKKTVEDAIERPIDDQQLMSYVMYPHVYMDYIKHRKACFDVSLLPTPVFLYGLEPGQEITVCLDEGKTLIIKLISVGSLRSDGTRTVYFELNGLQRTVSVRDNSAQTTVKERVKADKFNKHQIGAPMPGKIFKIVAKPGEDVKAGDVVIVTEAMKMETNIKSPIDGKVKEVLYDVGEAIEKDDLLVVLE